MVVTAIWTSWPSTRWEPWLQPIGYQGYPKWTKFDSAGRAIQITAPFITSATPKSSGYVYIPTFVTVRRESDGVEIGNAMIRGKFTSSDPNKNTVRVDIIPTPRSERLIVQVFAQGEDTRSTYAGEYFSAGPIYAMLDLMPLEGKYTKLTDASPPVEEPVEEPPIFEEPPIYEPPMYEEPPITDPFEPPVSDPGMPPAIPTIGTGALAVGGGLLLLFGTKGGKKLLRRFGL